MAEEWRQIAGSEGRYEVSDLGRVRSLLYRRQPVTATLKFGDSGAGYQTVWLGRSRKAYVHHLVLAAFVGECPEGMECRHLNGNRSDNRLGNLAWGTKAQNGRDKVDHGNSLLGEANPSSVLSSSGVRLMRELRSSGSTYPELGRRFGVSKDTARLACIGKTWSHV